MISVGIISVGMILVGMISVDKISARMVYCLRRFLLSVLIGTKPKNICLLASQHFLLYIRGEHSGI